MLRDKNIVELNISITPDEVEKKHIIGREATPCEFEDEKLKAKFAGKHFFSRYLIEVPSEEIFSATFIPCKDMLTHSNGFLAMANTYKNFPFDKTLIDIVAKNSRWQMEEVPKLARKILPALEDMMDGEVVFENENFFINKRDGKKIIFNIEAEGLKKIGLLWQLLMTGSISENSILIWDEPEANLNPKFFPKLI